MQLKKFLFILLIVFCTKAYSQVFQSNIINDFKEYNVAAIGLVEGFQLNLRTNNFLFSNTNYSGFNGNAIVSFDKLNSTIRVNGDYYQSSYYEDYKNFRYGFSYAYNHSFSDQSNFILGVAVSIFSKRDTYNEFYINNIPYNKKEFKSDKLNIDVGIWYQYKKLGLGISYNHINTPEHKVADSYYWGREHLYIFRPELNVILDHKFNLTQKLGMHNNLFLYDLTEYSNRIELNMNNILVYNNTYLFGSYFDLVEGERSAKYIGVIGGVKLLDKYKLITGINIFQIESNKNYGYEIISKRSRTRFECTFSLNF